MDAATAERAPCGLLELASDYTILSANRYFLELTGRTEADIAGGLKFHALLSVAGRIFVQTRLQQELALTGRLEELALDILRPDGDRIPAMLNASQSIGEDGRPGPILMALWRAAAKRAYEAEVPKARQAAEQAARVKTDFLANVSHEIRTPLNGVIAVADVLGRTSLSAQQRDMVDLITSSATLLERLLSDILDISKMQSGALRLEIRPFDLRHELAGVLGIARLRAQEKRLDFAVTMSPDAEGRYLGDATRLKQVVGNLTSNAVKFTDAGQVSVEVAADPAGALVITVTDTGIGFGEAERAILFDRFQQADGSITRRFGGTGLGLSISRDIVELMGGSIETESRPGHGSRFRVRLPLPRAAEGGRETPDPAPAPDARTARKRAPRVLLVEDNRTNQRVVEMILAASGTELTIAENGQEGLDAWREGRFDVVLMDIQMPVMDGLTAIRKIRSAEADAASGRRTPIIVLSANAMDHHRQEALEAGADLHLGKPVTPQALLGGIRTALKTTRAAT